MKIRTTFITNMESNYYNNSYLTHIQSKTEDINITMTLNLEFK